MEKEKNTSKVGIHPLPSGKDKGWLLLLENTGNQDAVCNLFHAAENIGKDNFGLPRDVSIESKMLIISYAEMLRMHGQGDVKTEVLSLRVTHVPFRSFKQSSLSVKNTRKRRGIFGFESEETDSKDTHEITSRNEDARPYISMTTMTHLDASGQRRETPYWLRNGVKTAFNGAIDKFVAMRIEVPKKSQLYIEIITA